MPIVDPFENQQSSIVDPFQDQQAAPSKGADLLGKAQATTSLAGKLPGLAADVGRSTAVDIIDMALGLPSMIANTLEAGAIAITALAHGDQHPVQAANTILGEEMAKPENRMAAAPLRTTLEALKKPVGQSPIGVALEKAQTGIEARGQQLGEATGIPQIGEATPQLVNAAMSLAGAHALGVAKARVARVVEAQQAGVSIPEQADLVLKKAAEKGIDTSTITKQHIEASLEDIAKYYGSGIERRHGDRVVGSQLANMSNTETQHLGTQPTAQPAVAPSTMPTEKLFTILDKNRRLEPKDTVYSPGGLEDVKQSIAKEGIKKPITVTISKPDNMALVTDGNTRVMASYELKRDTVPTKFEKTEVPFTAEQKTRAKPLESLGLTQDMIPDKIPTKQAIADRAELRALLGEDAKTVAEVTPMAPHEGAVAPITGSHFSQAQRETLSGTHFGSGLKAEESYRLKLATDPRIKTRIAFYVDEGKGVFPEAGVGAYRHDVPLNNLYDASKNPLKLPATEDFMYGDDAGPGFNRFESAVLDNGYDGYYIRGAFGRQGAAVLMGKAAEAVKVPHSGADATINVGLHTNDGVGITPTQVEAVLREHDVTVSKAAVHQSGTEPTFVGKLSRALTPEEAHQVSVALKQEAIAQHANGIGELYGPKAEAWKPFNPDYFLTPEGEKLSTAKGQAFHQRGAIGAIYVKTHEEAVRLTDRVGVDRVINKTPRGYRVDVPMTEAEALDLRRTHPEDVVNLTKSAEEMYRSNYFKRQRGAVGDLTPTVKRAADFHDTGEYEVTVEGKTERIYRDPESGWWYRAQKREEKQTHYVDRSMGFNKKEAIENVVKYMGKKQMGVVDKQLIANAGLMLGGAALGAALSPNETTQGLLLGAAIGFGLANLPRAASAIAGNWKSSIKTAAVGAAYAGVGYAVDKNDPIEGILVGSAIFGLRFLPKTKAHPEDQLINARNGNIAAEKRLIAQVSNAMKQAVPDAARREQLSVLMENPKFEGTTPAEKSVVSAWRGMAKSYHDLAVDSNVKIGFIEGYVSHIVERGGLPQSEVTRILTELFGQPQAGVGGKAKFTKERAFPTFESLEKALDGTSLKIKTKDIAEITQLYAETMTRTIENQRLINNLKEATLGDPNGSNAVLLTTEQQPGYMKLANPQLLPYYVHPDVAPALKFVFDSRNHNELTNGLVALNRATKRMNVIGSFFHAKSLMEAYALAGGNIFSATGAIDSALKQFREGSLGDEIDKGMRAGLRVELPTEVSQQALAQVGQLADFYASKMTGKKIGFMEKAGSAVESIQQKTFDKFTWDYLHTGLKTATYLRLMEDYKLGLKGKGMTEDVYRQGVASHINDTFGGLDWYRVVSEAKTEAVRKYIMMPGLKPSSRDLLGIAIFAPDWTISTLRAVSKALPGGAKNPANAALARQYVLRTAVLYGTVITGVNYALSGHFPWDNKDPTRIDLGDGTNLQVVKHSMEFAEWVRDPWKTFGNKMGFLPRTFEALQTGKQYPGGPPVEGRLGYVTAQVAPFTARSFQGDIDPETSAARSLLGMFGISVYGMTEAEKEYAREARAARKAAKQEITDPFAEE